MVFSLFLDVAYDPLHEIIHTPWGIVCLILLLLAVSAFVILRRIRKKKDAAAKAENEKNASADNADA